jgi:hypothetical protein
MIFVPYFSQKFSSKFLSKTIEFLDNPHLVHIVCSQLIVYPIIFGNEGKFMCILIIIKINNQIFHETVLFYFISFSSESYGKINDKNCGLSMSLWLDD